MPRGISVGNLAANGALSIKVQTMSASEFGLLVTGTAGVFGSLALEGGDGEGNDESIYVSDTDGSAAAIAAIAANGLYMFRALCDTLTFTLSASTTPDIDLILYPKPRS